MLDKSTDSRNDVNAEQQAASTKCSTEVCAVPVAQTSFRSRENVTTLDFNQGNIYGDAQKTDARPATADLPVGNDSAEYKSLSADVERKMAADPNRMAIFKDNMDKFALRAAEMQLPQSEVSAVYKNVDRLLQTQDKGLLSGAHRLILAEQIMEHSARPYGINQGNHDTCPLNALEVRAFDKDPGAAAALIADVALTGAYHSKDGKTFRINPVPHDEAAWGVIFDGTRSHASEIFQVTAANIFADRATSAAREQGHDSPTVHLEQRRPSSQNSTGETFVAYYPHGRAEVVKNNNPFVVNSGNAGWLPETLTAITGKTEPGTFVARDTSLNDKSPNISRVASAADLQDMLVKAKTENKFPITVFLYTGNEPFWSDQNASGTGVGHVVNITGFEPGVGPDAKSYAQVDNSWHDWKDHGADNPIELNTLYNAMAHADKSVPYLQDQAAKARASGSADYGTEIDILRIQALYGMTSPDKFIDNFNRTVDEKFFKWIDQLPPQEQAQTYHKLTVIQNKQFAGGSSSGSGGNGLDSNTH